ncbi:MAG: GPR endopeptidase [Defluviitaleaceae bacterium]|nr:GPR endopeptidase [Defluviitaleaceae bacterium]
MQNIYTDLAMEMAEGLDTDNLTGIEMDVVEQDSTKITTIHVVDEQGANTLGKPMGSYITIESPEIKQNNFTAHEEIMGILVRQLALLRDGLGIDDNGTVLVIGLGNRDVTPDALGPKVVEGVLVTRHIMGTLPEELLGGLRPISALAPGVMGMTGIETAEVVKGLVGNVCPQLVIAIDALAARSINRINQTIQLTDTGISPGAGVGNRRAALDEATLGVPVIAIGVPTVVDAATFVNDTLDIFLAGMAEEAPEHLRDGAEFFRMLTQLEEQDKYAVIRNSLEPAVGNMFVTPKEIGEVVKWLAGIIANGINIAMHKGIDMDDINRFMY